MYVVITGAFIILDMITGVIKAIKNKDFKSSVMREGLFHKCGSALCVVFGFLVEYAQSYIDLGFTLPVASAICGYICFMEVGSILENISAINPEIVPEKIREVLANVNKG